MKDIAKISKVKEKLTVSEITRGVIIHFFVFLSGIALSRTVVIYKLLPFGLSFVAAANSTFLPSAALGVFTGYFFPALGNGGFRYIASMFAIVAIKMLLSNYKKLTENAAFLTIIALLSNLMTSAVALKDLSTGPLEVVSECILCAVATYFFARCFVFLLKPILGLSNDELASLLISVGILILGFNSINFGELSLGRILSVTLILLSAKYGGILAASLSGITVALTLSVSGVSGNIGISLAFSALLSGVLASYGKYVEITVLLLSAFLGAVTTLDVTLISRTFIESALGSVIFLVLPKSSGVFLGKILCASPKVALANGFKKSVSMRLELASNALKDVSETVEQVSSKLSRINAPDFSSVITAIERDGCAGCKLRVHCWETKKNETVNAITEMTKAVKQGDCSPENNAPDEFKGRCHRVTRVGNAVYKRFSDYASHIAAENRIDEVREVVSDQFDGISAMLYDLSCDFLEDDRCDTAFTSLAASALKNLNIRVKEASGRFDKYGRLSLEFRLKNTKDLVLNKMQIMKIISTALEREFAIPSVNKVGNDIYITLCEQPKIRVDIGVEQSIGSDSNMCGDSYKYFLDGRGHFTMILSDGMGTGGRAAVDSAMASGLMTRLLKAGFGFDCSLRILNSSMLFKSTDESLATLDIANIDLFDGKTELFKAGAAPTIVRRSGKTGKAQSTSLPAGILSDVRFDKAAVKCKTGDIIVLMSDGAIGAGTDWIRDEIEAWQEGTAQNLAEKLCYSAKRRRNDSHQDDITVMVAILEKNI